MPSAQNGFVEGVADGGHVGARAMIVAPPGEARKRISARPPAENAARMRSTKVEIVCWSVGAEGAAQQNCRGEEERPTLREKQEREG
jgi:hypothetical protein